LKSGKSERAKRLDDLGVDAVPDVRVPFHLRHVGERRPRGDYDRRLKVSAVGVLVTDVLDEQHEQDVVLVHAGIHAAAEGVAGGPEGGVEVGFFERHSSILLLFSDLDLLGKTVQPQTR
jgi:hypothetical protein